MESINQESINEYKKKIEVETKENKVILYMKGNKEMPQCGFSAQVVQILNETGVDYDVRNVLEDPILREAIKDYSDWPTIPQLYINSEFIGGCDIIMELFQNGELTTLLNA